VYGNLDSIPFSEDANVSSPESLYAATKVTNELFASVYNKIYGMSLTGLRFFTVYGPWGRPDMAPFLFTDAILHDKPIRVFNNGNLYRDFTYIDDIVTFFIKKKTRYISFLFTSRLAPIIKMNVKTMI
jgi:UDP-glucuronate 4-epimerase